MVNLNASNSDIISRNTEENVDSHIFSLFQLHSKFLSIVKLLNITPVPKKIIDQSAYFQTFQKLGFWFRRISDSLDFHRAWQQ